MNEGLAQESTSQMYEIQENLNVRWNVIEQNKSLTRLMGSA